MSSSDGHMASASPSRMPGVTPAAFAADVTQPTRGSVPGSGASAAARVARRGRSRRAARSSNPGMRMQATMGTYVLHEHAFPCKPVLQSLDPLPESDVVPVRVLDPELAEAVRRVVDRV